MTDRSPNFPSISLPEAIEAIKKVHATEGRAKAPRLSIVKPLGYNSLNGRSLSVLGALKAYGLLDGRGEEMRISENGFILANAPAGSPEYCQALVASFQSPAAFQHFGNEDDAASVDTLKWKLQKSGFQADSAERLVRVYRESRQLVNSISATYDIGKKQGEDSRNQIGNNKPAVGDVVRWVSQGVVQFEDRQLLGFSDDGQWAFVEGSRTGVPMSEIEIVECQPPEHTSPPPPIPAALVKPTKHAQTKPAEPDFVVKLGDGRVAVIEIKGGEPEARHLAKLARFIKLQEEMLSGDDQEAEVAN